MLVEVLEPVVGLAEEGRQRLEAAHRATLADLEQDPLGAVDRHLGVVRLLVADRRDLAGRADQVAEDRLALDDPPVVLDVHRGRHHVHQAGQVGGPTDRLEPIAPRQLVAQRHQVDRLALPVQAEHRLVDVGVLLPVEVGRMQEVGDLEDRLGVDQDRAEHALLGLDGLRRQAINHGGEGAPDPVWVRRTVAGRAPIPIGRCPQTSASARESVVDHRGSGVDATWMACSHCGQPLERRPHQGARQARQAEGAG